MQTGDDPVSTI